jgi:hypothetical protein
MKAIFPGFEGGYEDHDPKCDRVLKDNYVKLQELVLKAKDLEKRVQV